MISKERKREYDRIYNIINKDKRRKYYLDNAEKMRQKTKDYRKKNPNYTKEYNFKNRDKKRKLQIEYRQRDIQATIEKRRQYNIKYKEKNRQYALKNKEKINQRAKERLREDIKYLLICRLRGRVNRALRRNSKHSSTKDLLGCTIEFLKKHLESKFAEGMTWDNRSEWHIDHIIPCSSFDMAIPEEQKKCFHYTNLQPLWAVDNLRKSCKVNYDGAVAS